ncbi:MAG: Ig-like domain-containing protein [Nitrosomonas sp.]|uniref:Ig-like domain-containing protein n=1 Tax=Nitrosomonas sp. TaxID=42353 RepID=UPI0025E1C4F1|nr:Ig-like domain-containing protein [Nitrosomonas sp.]UJP03181.1 MAG: Ig-like domain-containing protein [Nitrosomonas sp.]
MASDGKITISSDTDTRIIDIHDTNQVIFHEYDNMIIGPVENLLPHTPYHIEIANGVITDSAGNPYEDIHAATALQFTTTDPYFITMTGVGSSDIMDS